MKNQSYALPNALAVTTAIVYVACRLLVIFLPDISFTIAQSWFHDISLSRQNVLSVSLSSFILGIISSFITAWIIGYIFTSIHSYFNKSK